MSIIHPALEAASLEEDFDLQEVWAHLLANAADPRAAAPRVIPAYAAILGELTSPDFKFLNQFCIHFEHSRHPKSTPLRLAVDQFGARPLSAVQRARRAEVAPADGTCNDLITN